MPLQAWRLCAAVFLIGGGIALATGHYHWASFFVVMLGGFLLGKAGHGE